MSEFINDQVKFWNPAKGYGFLDTIEKVFFHVASFRKPRVKLRRGLPTLVFVKPEWVDKKAVIGREIKEGDWISYESQKTEKGLSAATWCFRDDFQAAKEELVSRPLYRFVCRWWSRSQPRAEQSIKGWVTTLTLCGSVDWTGFDTDEIDLQEYRPNPDYQFQIQQATKPVTGILSDEPEHWQPADFREAFIDCLAQRKYEVLAGDGSFFKVPLGYQKHQRVDNSIREAAKL